MPSDLIWIRSSVVSEGAGPLIGRLSSPYNAGQFQIIEM
ncbi:hypothetical protein [Azospirillum endophyticum]